MRPSRKLGIIFIVFLMLISSVCHAIEIKGLCRHRAIYCALVIGEHYRTRIVSGITVNGIRHAQAQARIDGSWEWLIMDRYTVEIGEQEYQWLLDNYGYCKVRDYVRFIKTKK